MYSCVFKRTKQASAVYNRTPVQYALKEANAIKCLFFCIHTAMGGLGAWWVFLTLNKLISVFITQEREKSGLTKLIHHLNLLCVF